MVPSAWPDRIPLPDTLQKNTDRIMQCYCKTCTFMFIYPAQSSHSQVMVDVPPQMNIPQRQEKYQVPVTVSVKSKHTKEPRVEKRVTS